MLSTHQHGLVADDAELKRPIAGLPDNHPHPNLTRDKHLALSTRHDQSEWLTDQRAATNLETPSNHAKDVLTWLTTHFGRPA